MALIKPIMDPFIHDWGHMPRQKSSAVKKLLRTFLRQVRRFTESSRVEKLEGRFSRLCTSCSSCGLSPHTDLGKGYFQTAYGILHAIYYNKYFVCHANQPEWYESGKVDTTRVRLCGNMRAITLCHYSQLIAVARKTMHEIAQIMRRPSR